METIITVAPELNEDRSQSIASPRFRQRHRLICRQFLESSELFHQILSRWDYFGLPRCGRCQLRRPRARMKVGFGFFPGDYFHVSFNSYLPVQMRPVENQRGLWICGELHSFTRRVICIKHETVRPKFLQQDDSRRHVTASAGSGKRHSRRFEPGARRPIDGGAEPQ